ncbi:hypothetical protein [Paraglaciecola sp. L1A13]|uniref:hypothetical protein n=1 Tax=Paraglaciecola sp. L1A13 TaxID=2686359 RepID=UPI00131CCFDF|nr:hypothetical protein [Paraglaciecola sp. L1A13]|tara:strand:+ start:840 stop:1307 length:468 start_codon:yes stop_codon:yes gene_type:complete
MKNLRIALSKIAVTAVISTFVLVGCSSQFNSSLRKVTYPPDFKYTEQADLSSDMNRLAHQMALLDTALDKPLEQSQNEPDLQREQVLNALKNIGKIASSLKGGDMGANHPFMEDYMQDFVSQIDKARTAASLPEPRYYLAGKVSGGCTNCHAVNR